MSFPQQTEITPLELEELLKQPSGTFVLLDVRTEREFNQGHIPGSVLLPVQELEARFSELPQDLPIVVVCHAGVRSAYALEILAEKGFQHIRHLPGGLMRLGYP